MPPRALRLTDWFDPNDDHIQNLQQSISDLPGLNDAELNLSAFLEKSAFLQEAQAQKWACPSCAAKGSAALESAQAGQARRSRRLKVTAPAVAPQEAAQEAADAQGQAQVSDADASDVIRCLATCSVTAANAGMSGIPCLTTGRDLKGVWAVVRLHGWDATPLRSVCNQTASASRSCRCAASEAVASWHVASHGVSNMKPQQCCEWESSSIVGIHGLILHQHAA